MTDTIHNQGQAPTRTKPTNYTPKLQFITKLIDQDQDEDKLSSPRNHSTWNLIKSQNPLYPPNII